ncbi:MAG TPA: hemerythrin domain-containing protein [Mycobacteriales bacterium]|nr:hemerythrin domain-containing protein [Mycobacteriales bacterium]
MLCEQHRTIRSLIETVRQNSPAGRLAHFDRLVAFLAWHEATEALLLRPVTRSDVLGGEVIADARAVEESRIRATVAGLTHVDPVSREFRRGFDDLARRLIEHLDSEERYEFPLVRAYRGKDSLAAMAAVMRRTDAPGAGNTATTATALAGAVINPLASAVSKVREVVAAARR